VDFLALSSEVKVNPWIIAAGAALGLLRAQQEERAAHEDRKVQGTKTRWATFTGNQGRDTPHTDTMGMVMQGAMAGALLGQQMAEKGDGAKGEEAAGKDLRNWNLYGNIPQNSGPQGQMGHSQLMLEEDAGFVRRPNYYGRMS
jgi:hypothetical protein